jgi:hypothetical protein
LIAQSLVAFMLRGGGDGGGPRAAERFELRACFAAIDLAVVKRRRSHQPKRRGNSVHRATRESPM